MGVDLDINNYNLKDVLNLFKIPLQFNETHLKQAKQVVLKTHPDKSGLPPEYFIFYSKAYKMVYSIWEFKKSATTESIDTYNTDYAAVTYNEEEKKELLNEFFESNSNMKNNGNFNKWFNQQFEKNKLHGEGEAKGYEDWLRRGDQEEPTTHTGVSPANMGELMEQKKAQIRALTIHQNIEDIMSSSNASDLTQSVPDTYDSDMFSQLSYQDLHKAHTQSVIPVTEEDYHSKQKFNTVNEYMSYRSQQDTKPLSEQQALQYLKNRTNAEDVTATRRAYQLAKEAEIVKQREQDFWSGIQMLKNK